MRVVRRRGPAVRLQLHRGETRFEVGWQPGERAVPLIPAVAEWNRVRAECRPDGLQLRPRGGAARLRRWPGDCIRAAARAGDGKPAANCRRLAQVRKESNHRRPVRHGVRYRRTEREIKVSDVGFLAPKEKPRTLRKPGRDSLERASDRFWPEQ